MRKIPDDQYWHGRYDADIRLLFHGNRVPGTKRLDWPAGRDCLFSFGFVPVRPDDFYLGCDKIIGGIGLNLFASGLTLLLMTVWFNEPGTYKPKGMPTLPVVDIPFLENIPVIGPALNGQSVLFL